MSDKARKGKIQRLVEKSKDVFFDCLLPNGCLVAAPSHMPYYPLQAKSYLYSWPGRDGGFSLTAALLLGLDYYEEVLRWLWERAENFRKAPPHLSFARGLILRSYFPNGLIREGAFQPDQNGTLLWAISEYAQGRKLTKLAEKVSLRLASGLVKHWKDGYFAIPTEDLWEERVAHPNFKTNLTYSLAADAFGLEWAGKYFKRGLFLKTAKKMKNLINRFAFDRSAGYFLRRFGGVLEPQGGIDASMLGLIFPFKTLSPRDERMVKTVEAIERKLLTKEGLKRYEYDEYEGEMEMGHFHFKQGAGAWPLLTFWLAIVQSRMGNREKGEKYFWQALDRVDDDLLIPEQIFPPGDPRVGVKPLLWSHAMFVHAAHVLGYLP